MSEREAGRMAFDSAGLGYTHHADGIHVHYPQRDEQGAVAYGAGFPIGAYPATPRSAADAERFALWNSLRATTTED